MNADFGALLALQPGLNPWLVVLLGSIAGLLAFAVSSAFYVLHMRHRRMTPHLPRPLTLRIRSAITATVIVGAVLALGLMIPGPKVLEATGWLSGDDLFTVNSRAGFVASYPDARRRVRKGDPILQLVRDAGPAEIAEATHRRALLVQDLEFTRLEIPRIDPLLLAAHAAEKDRLAELLERRRSLLENKESLLRGARRQKLTDQSQLDEVERDLQAARYELDQVEASFRVASVSFATASNPEVAGLFPKDEVNRREERAAVLRSRREELRERIALLVTERRRLLALTATSEETQAEHMTMRGTELEELDREIAPARERLETAWQAIARDRVRAERQREYRVRQIELQIAEYDGLLNARRGVLDVRAPWDALVGFREPSPASARFDHRPLLVLYKPGSIAVSVHLPTDRSELRDMDGLGIDMRAMIPETASTTFTGKIARGARLPDGSGDLQIAVDPPGPAIRELATGSAVPVHVVIRRLNPLAAAEMSWAWWLAGALVMGSAFSEARLWRFRRTARSASGAADAITLQPNGPRLDWGGDPDEFLEYVAGVGIVPRKLRRAVSAVEGIDEQRIGREQSGIRAPHKVQGSLPS